MNELQIVRIKEIALHYHTKPLLSFAKHLYESLKIERTIKLFMDKPIAIIGSETMNNDHESTLEHQEHTSKLQLMETLLSSVHAHSRNNVTLI